MTSSTKESSQKPQYLRILPPELVLYLLSLASAREILYCAATCRYLQELVRTSSELQLIVELAVQGLRLRHRAVLRDAAAKRPGDDNPVDRLARLREAVEAWETLEPIKTASIPLERYEYELGEGLLGHALKDPINCFRGLDFQRLWISEDTLEEEEEPCSRWKKYKDFGMDLMDFSFDLSEDLLVLVEDPSSLTGIKKHKRIHLHALSTNAPHPKAKRTYLESQGSERWYQCDIKISRSILAIHFAYPNVLTHNSGRLTVWNWKTGEQIYTCSGVGGYAFLSPDYLLVLGLSRSNLNVDVLQLEIVPISSLDSDPFSASAAQRFTLGLPLATVPEGVYVFSDKPLADSYDFPTDLDIMPYVLDETAERIVVVQLLPWNHFVFISTRQLLQLIHSPAPPPEDPQVETPSPARDDSTVEGSETPLESTPSSPSSPSPSSSTIQTRHFPWQTWGINGTFWMSGEHLQCGYTSVLGARFCAISGYERLFETDERGVIVKGEINRNPCAERDGEERSQMLLLDFNPRPIVRERSKKTEQDGDLPPGEERREGKGDDAGGEGTKSGDDNEEGVRPPPAMTLEEKASEERAKRHRGRIEIYSEVEGGLGEIGEWACISSHLDRIVVTRLPFRAFQKEDTNRYLDFIIGMDHLIGISHSYDVMQFAKRER